MNDLGEHFDGEAGEAVELRCVNLRPDRRCHPLDHLDSPVLVRERRLVREPTELDGNPSLHRRERTDLSQGVGTLELWKTVGTWLATGGP